MELLLRDLDPPERARGYAEAAWELLEQAREELKSGDARRAAEKACGAAALAVKAYAAWRDGRRLASHGELWEYKRVMARELGSWVSDAWYAGQSMHICFYEGWCAREDVEEALERIERPVRRVRARGEIGETGRALPGCRPRVGKPREGRPGFSLDAGITRLMLRGLASFVSGPGGGQPWSRVLRVSRRVARAGALRSLTLAQ